MKTLTISTGHPIHENVTILEADTVRFLAPDGRCMFEVKPCLDGRSIAVRGVEVCRIDGKLYSEALQITPHVANSITISTVPYDKG